MSEPKDGPGPRGEAEGFYSLDVVDLILYDGPENNVTRPPSPLLYKLGLAEREKLIRYGAMPPSPPPPPPPDMPTDNSV
jgi:hypothetical protein